MLTPSNIVWVVVDPVHNSGDRFAPAIVVEVGEANPGGATTCRVVTFFQPAVGQTYPSVLTVDVYPDRATAANHGFYTAGDPIAASAA